MPETHGAYKLLTLAKQGQLPDKRSKLGRAVKGIERAVIDHFGGELNNLQQIELFNLLPLIVFLLSHPMDTDGKRLADDWRWAWLRVENGLKVLVELGDQKPQGNMPSLDDWMRQKNKEKEDAKN